MINVIVSANNLSDSSPGILWGLNPKLRCAQSRSLNAPNKVNRLPAETVVNRFAANET